MNGFEALLTLGRWAAAEQVVRRLVRVRRLPMGLDASTMAAELACACVRAREAPGQRTEGEREVLALLAEGMANPQIGERLYISPRTASVHVSRILRKLEVTTRGEAAALAHRLELTSEAPTDPS